MTLVLFLSLVLIPSAVQRVRAKDNVERLPGFTEITWTEPATPMPVPLARGSHRLVCRQSTIPLSAAGLSVRAEKQGRILADESRPSYKGNPAALVAYQTSTEKISLLVASANSVVVAGGEEVRSGSLTFHYRSEANFEVITWTNHGLAYALVSS